MLVDRPEKYARTQITVKIINYCFILSSSLTIAFITFSLYSFLSLTNSIFIHGIYTVFTVCFTIANIKFKIVYHTGVKIFPSVVVIPIK